MVAIQPKRWRCGDEFENHIPAGSVKDFDSDIPSRSHRKVAFDACLEADQKQCDLWKDEVGTLLIFAGLFSAVVTAFLIESYKLLLPQGNSAPITFGSGSIDVVRLNSLWFASLVLALSTVVIGIVGLQWLRNHQRYHGVKPRDALSLLEMRTKALRAWHIRWTFLSLPLIILVALVLFLVGLVDFLLALDTKVATVVAVLAYITIAFLVLSTILPSLQIFKLSIWRPNVENDKDMPSPCPYKSPQSWIFHRALIVIIVGFQKFLRFILQKKDRKFVQVSQFYLPLYLTLQADPKKWLDFDLNWLRLRDMYSQTMRGNYRQDPPYEKTSLLHPRRPIYDEAQIITNSIKVGPSPDVLFAVYHCFQEISKDALFQHVQIEADNAWPQYQVRNQILRGYYWKHLSSQPSATVAFRPRPVPIPFAFPISHLFNNPSVHLLHDENMFVFLQMHASHNLPDAALRLVAAHLCELQTRILTHAYAPEDRDLNQPFSRWSRMLLRQYIHMIDSTKELPTFKIWSQFSPGNLNDNEVPLSTETIHKTITQYSMVFKTFVQQIATATPQEAICVCKELPEFLKVPATMFRYIGSDQMPFDVSEQFAPSLATIQTALHAATFRMQNDRSYDPDQSSPADLLFLMACNFIEQLFHCDTEDPVPRFPPQQCKRIADLVRALHDYEQADRSATDRIQTNFQKFWIDTKLIGYARYALNPAIVGHLYRNSTSDVDAPSEAEDDQASYICWEYIPPWIYSDKSSADPDDEDYAWF